MLGMHPYICVCDSVLMSVLVRMDDNLMSTAAAEQTENALSRILYEGSLHMSIFDMPEKRKAFLCALYKVMLTF